MVHAHPVVVLLPLLALSACGERARQADMEAASADVVMMLPVTTSSEEARRHFFIGQRAMDEGRSLDANAHFKMAAETDQSFAFAHLSAANTATSLDAFLENLKKAEEHAAHASEAERLLIEITRKSFDNDVEGELAAARRLVEIQPESPRAWLALAGAQSSAGDEPEARASMTKATEIAPTFAPAYIALGNSYLLNDPRDPNKAESIIAKAIELEPDVASHHDFLGDAYRQLGELEKAGAAYTRAAELDPENGLYPQQRGHVNTFLGNFEEARADYDAGIANANTRNLAASFGVYRALVSVHAGQPQAAIDELEALVTRIDGMGLEDPRGLKIFALTAQAQIALHHKLLDAARTALDRRAALMREQADAVGTEEFRRAQEANIAIFEGYYAAQRGDYAAAKEKAREYMTIVEPDRDPTKNRPAHELLGFIAVRQGNHAEAVAHYEQGSPNNPYSNYYHAVALEGAGRTDEAKALYRSVAEYRFNAPGLALVRRDAIEKAS